MMREEVEAYVASECRKALQELDRRVWEHQLNGTTPVAIYRNQVPIHLMMLQDLHVTVKMPWNGGGL